MLQGLFCKILYLIKLTEGQCFECAICSYGPYKCHEGILSLEHLLNCDNMDMQLTQKKLDDEIIE